MKELSLIQQELNCPKDRTAVGGRYSYRSCSDILDAFKKVSHGCQIVISDEIVEVGSALFVKATATITNEAGEKEVATALAGLGNNIPSSMDSAKWTGACSSYARKYALNGLLAIDDTVDNDGLEDVATTGKQPKNNQNDPVSQPQPQPEPLKKGGPVDNSRLQEFIQKMKKAGWTLELVEQNYDLTEEQLSKVKEQIH